MAALDKMIIDDRDLANRYFGENTLDDLNTDQFLFSKQTKTTQEESSLKSRTKQDTSTKEDDLTGLFGRRVYLESPSFDNKEEEDMYRYVPSRLSEVPAPLVEGTAPTMTTDTLIDSLDFELDLLGAAHTRHRFPYRTTTQLLQDSKPPAPLTQLQNPSKPFSLTNAPRADPRQDPLLGPLLAELDTMTTQQQQQQQQLTQPMYRRNSVPYEPNLIRPAVQSQSNHLLSNTANRTVNEALLEAELYDSLDPKDHQPSYDRQHIIFSAPNSTSSHQIQQQQPQRLPPRPLNMNNVDVFMPTSYDNGTGVFSNQYGANDQMFQQPLLNALGQNYVPNARQQPSSQHQQQLQPQTEQRDKSYDDIYSRMSPPQRSGYGPSQQQPANNNTSNHQYQSQPQQQQRRQQQQQQHPQQREPSDKSYDDIYSRMSPPNRAPYMPAQHQQQPQHQPNNMNPYQHQLPPPVPNRQATYNNNNIPDNENDPFNEFQDMFGTTQYQHTSQLPPQQYPPTTQQPRMMPPPAASQHQSMPPGPPSFRQQRMPPPAQQQQTMNPSQPPPFPQTRMPQPPAAPASFQQPRMPPPQYPSQQQQQQQQQQQYQKSPVSTQQNDEYHSFSPFKQQQQHPHQQQYYDEEFLNTNYPSNNQDMFFTDVNDDQFDQNPYQQQHSQGQPMSNQQNVEQQDDQDSKRQAVWNELQRTNAKVQEKNAKKRESANRRDQILKGTYVPNNAWTSTGSKLSSAQSKTGAKSPPARRPPLPPASNTNYIEENIDMIKNKENFYHRYPAKKYENLYSKRKDLFGGGTNNNQRNEQNGNQNAHNNFDQVQPMNHDTGTYSNSEHQSNLPVTINLNPGNRTQNENLPATVSIPLDSHITRVGDKISVNIDVRLLDLQNMKQQQQNHGADHSGLDPLDRHIRKLENSIDQSLPPTHSPPRRSSPPASVPYPIVNPSIGRYGKTTLGSGQSAYSPPSYKSTDHYSYSAKARQEDSYLSKLTHVKKPVNYKPYTGRDFEQFKKNYAFGSGYLGFDYDNPEYKEKSDKILKTKEYAQQIEVRNKKILADAPRRTLSETRKPQPEPSVTQRALEYARVSTRHKIPLNSATQPSPPYRDEPAPLQRRPTEVPRPPPVPRQAPKVVHNDDHDLVERLAQRHERDKAQVQGILNPSQKRREQLFDDDDHRMTDVEKLAQERANQRRSSPPKQPHPPAPSTNGNARRPLRFDKPLLPDEPVVPSQPQTRVVPQPPTQQLSTQQQPAQAKSPAPQIQHTVKQQHSNVDQLANRHNDEKILMEAIRKELSERPLDDDEELVVVEQ
ncbi:unnamed protein product [Adineta ricciae]|nr:unnamed protein product [Adineta ricciae]